MEKLKIILEAKPLSINKCFQGRRYKTRDYKDYERTIYALLIHQKARRGVFNGKVELDITFHLKRASTTDFDNLLKPLFDILVANKIIPDDRHIWELKVKKKKSEIDKIEIIIKKRK